MADENKCKHEPCACSKGKDSDYCSVHCEDADDRDIVEIKCDCGHSNCN